MNILMARILCVASVSCAMYGQGLMAAEHAGGDTAGDAEAAHEHAGLEDVMESIGSDYKMLYKTLAKNASTPENIDHAALLAAVKRLHTYALQAAQHIPEQVRQLKDAAKKEQMLAQYAEAMKHFAAAIAELELHITAKDYAAALAQVKALKKHKKEGHGTFDNEGY